jgi:septation ring formation regulator EzrA
MEIRSGGLPQGSVFSEVLGLLELIGDTKKTKQVTEDLASDIADLQAAYQVNVAQLADVEKQKQELMDGFEKLKKDQEILEAKQNEYFKVASELDETSQKLNEDKKEFEKEKKEAIANQMTALLKLEDSQIAANKKFDDAIISLNKSDALIAEYDAKLKRMKEMVG